MTTFAIDFRHVNSNHPTGKAVYTRRLSDHLTAIADTYALCTDCGLKEDIANLKEKSFSKIFFHFSAAIFIKRNNLKFFSTESYITPLILSLIGGSSTIVVHDLIAFNTKDHKFFPALIEKICLPLLIKFKKNNFLFSTKSQLEDFREMFNVKKNNLFVFFPGEKNNSKPKFKKNKKFITFNATFLERKNQLILVKAFKLIANSIDKNLILVGKFTNPYVSIVQNYINKNNLSNKVTLKDYVEDKELEDIISNTALLVNPSTTEGFGLQILEALSKGIPCLLSDILVFKEVFKNSCLYFDNSDPQDLADKILFVNNNLELQKQLSLNAESVLKAYDYKKTFLKFKSLIKKI